jgi:hypothetical protein
MCASLQILHSSYSAFVNHDSSYSKLAVKSIDESFLGGDEDLKDVIESLDRLKDYD